MRFLTWAAVSKHKDAPKHTCTKPADNDRAIAACIVELRLKGKCCGNIGEWGCGRKEGDVYLMSMSKQYEQTVGILGVRASTALAKARVQVWNERNAAAAG